ncbi:MAG: peptidyl-prolyl cis-trans isomerase [Flavobacteriaceae bacterium]
MLTITAFWGGCDYWKIEEDVVLARVGSSYLYESDLKIDEISYENQEDSILKLRNLIDSWAKNNLLLQQAQLNLNEEEIEKLETLVDQYRLDLFSNTYKQAVINESLDSLVSASEIDSFLLNNKEIFRLNAPLFQVRYIHFPPENVDQREIESSFERFNESDQVFLDSLSFQYYDQILKDSIWLSKSDLLSEVTFLNNENLNKYLKKSKFFEVQDSLGVYLFYIKDYLRQGDLAPREVLNPTIKNILLNQRKLKLLKQFEKDILQDAIKSKNYEIY